MRKIDVFGVGAGLGYLIGKYGLTDVMVNVAVAIKRYRDEQENARVVDVFGDEIIGK